MSDKALSAAPWMSLSDSFSRAEKAPVIVYLSTPPGQPTPSVSEWEKPATYTSSVALLLSLFLAFYTFRKDSRARKHSVEDDYWLRKVVGPIAIEPLLKEILEMIAEAPDDTASAKWSPESFVEYHDKYVPKLATLAVQSSSLQIIDKALATSTAGSIDQIQDLMIEYCFANNGSTPGGGQPSAGRSNYQNAAKEHLVRLLQPIRDYHVRRVGTADASTASLRNKIASLFTK